MSVKSSFAFCTIAAALLSATIATSALAAPGGRADKDGDRIISRAEAAGHPMLEKNFDLLDTNKDGKLSRQEIRAGREGMMQRHLAEIDVNKDGWIDRNEAAKAPMLAKHFDQIDTNKDGLLAKAELAAAKDKMRHGGGMKMLDKNNDGAVDRAEAAGHPRLEKNFDAIDTNKDGKLSMDELKAYRRTMHGPK